MTLLHPERLGLVLCEWVQLHLERDGETHALRIGEKQYIILDFQFEDWHFPKCGIDFFLTFQKNFPDRMVGVTVVVCEDCQKELRHQLDSLIIDSQGIPPEG